MVREERRQAIQTALDSGETLASIGHVLGVSRQRVKQLAEENRRCQTRLRRAHFMPMQQKNREWRRAEERKRRAACLQGESQPGEAPASPL